jgi:hypothetical protein
VGSTSVSALLICVHGSGGGFAHCHTHLLREVFTVEHGTAQCQLVVQCVIPRKSHSASPSVQLEGLTYGSKKATANLASQRFLFFGWKMVGPPHQFSSFVFRGTLSVVPTQCWQVECTWLSSTTSYQYPCSRLATRSRTKR